MRTVPMWLAAASMLLPGCILPPAPLSSDQPIATPAPFPPAPDPPPPPGLLLRELAIGPAYDFQHDALLLTGSNGDSWTWDVLRNETSGFGDLDIAHLESLDFGTSFAVIVRGIDSTCRAGAEIDFVRAFVRDETHILEYTIPRVEDVSTPGAQAGAFAAPCMAWCGAQGIAIIDRFLPGPVTISIESGNGDVWQTANEVMV